MKMKMLIMFLMSGISIATHAQTVDFSAVQQTDLINFQKKITEKANKENRALTSDEIDVLSRINKAKFTNNTTVSFSKVPKDVLDADLTDLYSRTNMYFSALAQFKEFKKSLRTAYSKDTSVITRVILQSKTSSIVLPVECNKAYFVNLARSND